MVSNVYTQNLFGQELQNEWNLKDTDTFSDTSDFQCQRNKDFKTGF